MTDRKDPPSLDDLEARIRAARGREEEIQGTGPNRRLPSSGMGLGFRIAIELVAGVMVGMLIGYGLDLWLGTRPLLMVLFLFLGSAAGLLNVYRAAKRLDSAVGTGRAQREKQDDVER